MKMYLAGSWEAKELVSGEDYGRLGKSYMGDDCHGDDESWECEAVADFLHRDTCGAQGR